MACHPNLLRDRWLPLFHGSSTPKKFKPTWEKSPFEIPSGKSIIQGLDFKYRHSCLWDFIVIVYIQDVMMWANFFSYAVMHFDLIRTHMDPKLLLYLRTSVNSNFHFLLLSNIQHVAKIPEAGGAKEARRKKTVRGDNKITFYEWKNYFINWKNNYIPRLYNHVNMDILYHL